MNLKHTSNSVSASFIKQDGIWLFNDFLSHFLTISTLSSIRRFLFSTGFVSFWAITHAFSSDEKHAAMPCKQFKSTSKLQHELETALRISKQDLAQRKTSSFQTAWSPEDLIQRNNVNLMLSKKKLYQLLFMFKSLITISAKSPGINLWA